MEFNVELKENDYILGVWMARDEDNNVWSVLIMKPEVVGKFRAYMRTKDLGDAIFTYDDPPSEELEEKIIGLTDQMFNDVSKTYPLDRERYIIKGGIGKFFFYIRETEFL